MTINNLFVSANRPVHGPAHVTAPTSNKPQKATEAGVILGQQDSFSTTPVAVRHATSSPAAAPVSAGQAEPGTGGVSSAAQALVSECEAVVKMFEQARNSGLKAIADHPTVKNLLNHLTGVLPNLQQMTKGFAAQQPTQEEAAARLADCEAFLAFAEELKGGDLESLLDSASMKSLLSEVRASLPYMKVVAAGSTPAAWQAEMDLAVSEYAKLPALMLAQTEHYINSRYEWVKDEQARAQTEMRETREKFSALQNFIKDAGKHLNGPDSQRTATALAFTNPVPTAAHKVAVETRLKEFQASRGEDIARQHIDRLNEIAKFSPGNPSAFREEFKHALSAFGSRRQDTESLEYQLKEYESLNQWLEQHTQPARLLIEAGPV